MSENYTIQDLGGALLAEYYPDCGPLLDSHSCNSILRTVPEVDGVWSWFGSLKHGSGFWAVLDANSEGVRVLVASDNFTIFIPWHEATVTAERSSPATIVRLNTVAVPTLDLVFRMDDEAADRLLQFVGQALPRREPPQRLLWWLDKPWQGILALAIGVGAALLMFWLVH
jgi:hypothetical protein